MRIAKYISNAGFCSRRDAEKLVLEKKVYVKQEFGSDYELLSLIGNVSLVDNKPFIHTHISFSDTNSSISVVSQ